LLCTYLFLGRVPQGQAKSSCEKLPFKRERQKRRPRAKSSPLLAKKLEELFA
jgi:hypothetical protein